MTEAPFRSRLVGSPACLPGTPSDQLFPAYRKIGFEKYEAFSSWAASRHEWTGDPGTDRKHAEAHGLEITSYHLPVIGEDVDHGLTEALAAARYASRLGDSVTVILKAARKELFQKVVPWFLDATERENLGLLTVVQNHKGTAISTLEDYEYVLESVNDLRLKALLEVGHFQRVGVSWREGWDLLGDRIALIHVNDIRNGQSVLFGTGEVNFRGLLEQIERKNYRGNIVVELELPSRQTDPEPTLEGLREAVSFLSDPYASPATS